MKQKYSYVVDYNGSKYRFSDLAALRYSFIVTVKGCPYLGKTTIRKELKRLFDYYKEGWGRLYYAVENLQHIAYKNKSYDAEVWILHDTLNDDAYSVYDASKPVSELYLCEDVVEFLGGTLEALEECSNE